MVLEGELWGTCLFTTSMFIFFAWKAVVTTKKHRMHDEAIVSCPGKVLVCGGYLVLDRAHIGVTIAADTARFYSIVKHARDEAARKVDLVFEEIVLVVRSPQFHAVYKLIYRWRRDGSDEGALDYIDDESSGKNLFVYKCLLLTLSFVRRHIGDELFMLKLGKNKCIEIELLANNDFYSQVSEVTPHCFIALYSMISVSSQFSYKNGIYLSNHLRLQFCHRSYLAHTVKLPFILTCYLLMRCPSSHKSMGIWQCRRLD